MPARLVPRIVLYAHDTSGFGHLRRVSRLAAELQEHCACVVITGNREASWLVDASCEYVKIPSWDNMYRPRARADADKLWLEMSKSQVISFRSEMIRDVIRVIRPAALIVDHIPFGLYDELLLTLKTVSTRRYLLTRGIIESGDHAVRSLLASAGTAAYYDRIMIAADKRVIDAIDDLPLSAEARRKCEWLGYIAHKSTSARRPLRSRDAPRVTCSAGSGMRGERMLLECIRVAHLHPAVMFDVVLGPRCTLTASDVANVASNTRVSAMRVDLPELHANSDIVITSGGYNSLLEGAVGGAHIIVCSANTGQWDEQLRHAKALQRYYPVEVADDVTQVGPLLEQVISGLDAPRLYNSPVDFGGLKRSKDIIYADLGVAQTDINPDLAEARFPWQ